jgi:hypothetical protein
MKFLSILFTVLTIAVSFTFNVWDGTMFALAPLLATIGGVVLRLAADRGDHFIGLGIGTVFGAAGWLWMEWLGLRVDLFGLDFPAGWWAASGLVVGFLTGPEEFGHLLPARD